MRFPPPRPRLSTRRRVDCVATELTAPTAFLTGFPLRAAMSDLATLKEYQAAAEEVARLAGKLIRDAHEARATRSESSRAARRCSEPSAAARVDPREQ